MLSEVGKMTYTLERKVKKDFSYKNTSEESFNFLKMRQKKVCGEIFE